MKINDSDNTIANVSATSTAHHMTSMPNRNGNSNTQPLSSTNVRVNEIVADTGPLFKAVKNSEAKMLIPVTMKCNE